jgi:hypothetical protein
MIDYKNRKPVKESKFKYLPNVIFIFVALFAISLITSLL